MDYGKYQRAAEYMRNCMTDQVHDCTHIYRVVNYALQILETEPQADAEVVVLAALLHDIGRDDESSGKSHAESGSEKAYAFLKDAGYPEETAGHVSDCILTHRYNSKNSLKTLEAKILYDADKLDLSGAVGTARTILFGGMIDEPMYLMDEHGLPRADAACLFREYLKKLRKLTNVFHTSKAQKIAAQRQKTMDSYFKQLIREVEKNHKSGLKLIGKYCRQ
ncbi:MAG: HD domain-containing protein [Defluviitaleaceae bacterium]|nr:HD domain-containing protein [Defluviitaleaceae bacterium]